LRETLDGLKVDVAKLQNMDRIESEAPDIGLISPQPDQIKVLYCSDLPPAPPSDDVHLLAAAQEGDGSDSQPSTEPSARASEGESWKSETGSQSGRVTAMMARLCRAIVDVYASYRGRS